MSTPFPTQLSDLHHHDPTTTPNLYHTLKHLKRSTLSLHNRLESILSDSLYITTTVQTSFPALPLIANERCGSWYIPPDQKSGSAYFKSTDGHYGRWDFSLRRLNLPVLETLGRDGGAILVDSTRRGKRMPDALRRTVPSWVAVWNRVLFAEEFAGEKGRKWEWAFRLQHPGLEPGEVSLMEAKVADWVAGLRGLDLDLRGLRMKVGKPIRLCWVVQGEEIPYFGTGEDEEKEDDDDEDEDECEDEDQKEDREQSSDILHRDEYNLFVLCSASRPVLGAEMSEDGYVQGAADDAEAWSGGLTSTIFWAHTDELMVTSEEELPELILRLIEQDKNIDSKIEAVQLRPTQNLFVAAATQSVEGDVETGEFDLIIKCDGKAIVETSHTINLGCRHWKLGSRDLRLKLPMVVERVSIQLKKSSDSKILIVCESGKDLSIGVAVALLCLLYDETGQLQNVQTPYIDKQFVKKRLAWITASKPDANPSRSTLQAVNAFLM